MTVSVQDCYDRCGANGFCVDDAAMYDGASRCFCNVGIAGEVGCQSTLPHCCV